MFIKSVQSQLTIIKEKKSYYLMFLLMFGWVLCNYFHNVFQYAGRDILDMYQPMRILTLADSGLYFYILMLLYPIIVIIPASFSYLYDQDVGEQIFLQSKIGITNYYLGKLVAVMIATFFVFTVPFLLEIILNCISFPLGATGLTTNINVYDNIELNNIQKLLFPNLYIKSVYAYTIISTLLFGAASSIIAGFSLALSMKFKFKFKALLLLPTYIMLYMTGLTGDVFQGTKLQTSYHSYFDLFDIGEKNTLAYIFIGFILLGISVGLVIYRSRKDQL